ncbi:unnamed protein product, partial [Closterium sp. NIES-54]
AAARVAAAARAAAAASTHATARVRAAASSARNSHCTHGFSSSCTLLCSHSHARHGTAAATRVQRQQQAQHLPPHLHRAQQLQPVLHNPLLTTPIRPYQLLTTPIRPYQLLTTPIRPYQLLTTPIHPYQLLTTPIRLYPLLTAPNHSYPPLTAPDRSPLHSNASTHTFPHVQHLPTAYYDWLSTHIGWRPHSLVMAAPRVLRFDTEGRALEFPSWLIRAEPFLKSQRQDNDTLWAHASGDLPKPPSPPDVGAEPNKAAQARFDKARSFDRAADLITHLRSLDVSYHAARTEAQLALPPPPMAITIHFITTSLPDRLAPVRDELLRKHPSELTIDVLETALKDIESNIRSVASASSTVVPPLFQGCTVPQLPTFTASLISTASPSPLETAAVSTAGGRSRGKGGKRGGKGGGAGGGGGGGGGSGDTSASGGGDTGSGSAPAGPTGGGADAVTWYTAQRRQQESRSGLYVLHSERSQVAASPQVDVSPQVAMSGQVPVSGLVATSCSCRSLSHPTVLWHHRLGHPSLPRLRSMVSQHLVSGLPRVFVSLPPSPAPLCTPCVEGRLRATPHSSSLRPATAPFQTLHLDVWGPAPRPGPERESIFLVVVDDYSGYTTVFPLAKNSDVTSTLIRWLLATETTRDRRVSCLHSDRGGDFCSCILRGFCSEQGITQSWMLPKSPQQNGVAERRIGLVMEISRTSMIHARAPHFLWPYAVRYSAHQLNLWPRVSRPGASPTSLWTGSPGVASEFRVWGCLALVRDTSVDKLSARAIPCVFLGFPVDSSDYTFYHPPLHRFLDSRDDRFSESVSYYTRYPCQGLPVPPPLPFFSPPLLLLLPLLRYPRPPQVLPRQQSSALPRQVTVDYGGVGARGASSGGAGVVGTDVGGASSEGAGAEGVGAGGKSSEGAGAEATGAGGARSRGTRAGGAGTGGASSGGARPGDTSSGGVGAGGSSSEETGAGGTATVAPTPPPHRYPTSFQRLRQLEREERERLEQERLGLERQQQELQQQQQPLFPPVSGIQALGVHSSPPDRSLSPLAYGPTFPPPDSSLAVFSPPWSHSSPPVVPHDWTVRCPARARPSSPFDDLRTVLLRSSPRRSPPHFVLPSPPDSSLTASTSTPITDYYRASRPVVTCVLASLVTDPRASPSSVSALSATVTDFAATRRLDYATHVVAARPLPAGDESALGCDVLEDRHSEPEYLAAASPTLCAMLLFREGDPDALDIPTPRTYCEAVSGPWASQWKAAMDSELASWRSTRTYVDAVPPPGPNVVDGMWIFKVKRPPGFPPVFKARYVARGFSQREGVDFFQTFAPTPKMTTRRLLLHVAAQRDYELHSLDFSTAFLQGSLHEEIWLCRPPGFTGTFLPGTYCTDWSLRLSYADDVEAQRSTQGYCFSLGAGAVQWRSTWSSSVASSSAEAEIYAGAMAAQELRWLTFLLTDLGERPSSAPTLFADNKAMVLLCREPRLESRVKHIDVRYFLLREL